MPAFAKRHYEAIAKVTKENLEYHAVNDRGETSEYVYGFKNGVEQMALDMAKVFQADNPAFDRARFLKACGLGV